jgi:UV DNA damage endonuclease
MSHPRIGFACQYRHAQRDLSPVQLKAIESPLNPRTTTLRWMDSVAPHVAQARLMEVLEHNLQAQLALLTYVASLPPTLRMLRLSSDLLPFYSHPKLAGFYQAPALQAWLGERFAAIGALARLHAIRLSLHPGQYCVLGSDKPQVVENSLAEFESRISNAMCTSPVAWARRASAPSGHGCRKWRATALPSKTRRKSTASTIAWVWPTWRR